MAPALDFGLVAIFGNALEIFRGQIPSGGALPGEFSRGRTGLVGGTGGELRPLGLMLVPRLAGTVGQTVCVPVSQTIEGEKSPRIKGFEYADGTVGTYKIGRASCRERV